MCSSSESAVLWSYLGVEAGMGLWQGPGHYATVKHEVPAPIGSVPGPQRGEPGSPDTCKAVNQAPLHSHMPLSMTIGSKFTQSSSHENETLALMDRIRVCKFAQC